MANRFGYACPACGSALAAPSQAPRTFGASPGWFNPYAAISTLGTMPGTFLTMYGGTGSPGDPEIAEMVLSSLDADPRIPFDSDIDVDVTAGHVTLRGSVPTKRIKHAAGDDAYWVPYVVDVHNELEVVGRQKRMRGQ